MNFVIDDSNYYKQKNSKKEMFSLTIHNTFYLYGAWYKKRKQKTIYSDISNIWPRPDLDRKRTNRIWGDSYPPSPNKSI